MFGLLLAIFPTGIVHHLGNHSTIAVIHTYHSFYNGLYLGLQLLCFCGCYIKKDFLIHFMIGGMIDLEMEIKESDSTQCMENIPDSLAFEIMKIMATECITKTGYILLMCKRSEIVVILTICFTNILSGQGVITTISNMILIYMYIKKGTSISIIRTY